MKSYFQVFFFLIVFLFSLLNPFPSQVAYAIDTPVLIAPVNGVEVTATGYGGSLAAPPLAIPTFQWSAVEGATTYRLQISQDIAFASKIEFTTSLTSYTPTNAAQFTDGRWYWRVRVDAPEASNYSFISEFWRKWASEDNYPASLYPGNTTVLQFYDAPTFRWEPVIGAASYRFQISLSQDFTSIPYNITTLATTHQPLLKLANSAAYYWRVIPLDPANREGRYSEVQTFTQGYNQVPVQIEPTDGANPTFTPTFRWTAVRGVQSYQLQYSTDPTFVASPTTVSTQNTTFTPVSTLDNDINYYWRVRTVSGNSLSDWSPVWTFEKKWYMKPVLLTPINLYQWVRFPFFSWTPVPGAKSYRIEIDTNNDFQNLYLSGTTQNTFYTPDQWRGTEEDIYWRVLPIDSSGKQGQPSEPFSFHKYGFFNTPSLVYPQYYYLPSQFPPPDTGVILNPHEDHTAPLPIFIWQRLTDTLTGLPIAKAFRLEVSTTSNFSNIVWTVDTQNLYAVPGPGEFTPLANTDYFWRVRALDELNNPVGDNWSQVWKARFDLTKGLPATGGAAPGLLRPVRGAELVELTPLFEWRPYSGADSYQIQISQDSAFTSTMMVDQASPYPAFAPVESFAQRDLGKLDYGTYYWRVRAHTASGWSSWTAPWRFQIASQSQWINARTLGNAANQLLVAQDLTDPVSPAIDPVYNLTNLYASQDSAAWYFGFNATFAGDNATFMLYLDVDHLDGSGGTFAPEGYTINTIPAHRPEYVLSIQKTGNSFSANDVLIYTWNGTGWNDPLILGTSGGLLFQDAGSGYVELKVPNTAIGMNVSTGSYAMALFSLPPSSGTPQDSTPYDPRVPGTGEISRFTSVSEKMNMLYPFNNLEGDPTTYSSMPPFFWEYPANILDTIPWNGALMEVHLDEGFTSKKGDYTASSTAAYYVYTTHAWPNDLVGDNSYYWRIRPRYTGNIFGVWSQGWRFERQGFIPLNMHESVSFATPTFTWDIAEGAQSYELQVDDDPGFNSANLSVTTTQNTYTPQGTLANGTYYWRLRIKREGTTNEWSVGKMFTISLPKPTGLTPNDPGGLNVVGRAPTFCWQPLLVSSGDTPVLAAYKYRLQISLGDPTFSSSAYETVETEQSCYTPTKGYADGTYYWRVAMIDGQSKVGDYSSTAVLTKQYPTTTLISPLGGNSLFTPTFSWTAVPGAASYKLEISLVPTFSPLYENITTNQITFTPTRKYQNNATYYWRVAIVDKDGKVGPFNDATIILGNKYRVYLPMTIKK